MRSADVVVGESYAYTRSRQYGTRLRIDVTDVKKVEKNLGWGKKRTTTVVVGTIHHYGTETTSTVEVEARELVETWKDHLAHEKRERETREQHEAKQQAEQQRRLPQVKRLEQILTEAGAPNTAYSYSTFDSPVGPNRQAHFQMHEAVKTGVVKISLDNLVALLDHLDKQQPLGA